MARVGSQTRGLYALSRQELQRWYYVEGLSPQKLQERYRLETGVYAHVSHLISWLKAPAQQLGLLENNEAVHGHACGEYVLDRLQNGVSADDVVQGLLHEYLVKTTPQRVLAYRRYREQMGEYWTEAKLSQHHWELLYSLVSLKVKFGVWTSAELQ